MGIDMFKLEYSTHRFVKLYVITVNIVFMIQVINETMIRLMFKFLEYQCIC